MLSVPLVFGTFWRDFSSPKVGLFLCLIGAAGILSSGSAPVARTSERAGRAGPALFLATSVCLLLLMGLGDGADDLAAASWYLALVLLCWLSAARIVHWPAALLIACVAIPLVIDLGLSLIQIDDRALLSATRASFGTTHGRLVGSIGNPNENAWYLLLATTLLTAVLWSPGTWPQPQRRSPLDRKSQASLGLLFALVSMVILLNRSRAAMITAIAALPVAAWYLGNWRTGRVGWLLAGSATACVLWLLWLFGLPEAAAGRWYLARVSLDMLLAHRGLPAGPGAYGADFLHAQAQWLEQHPTAIAFYSKIDHAHFDLLELLYELGVPIVVMFVVGAVALHRLARRGSALLMPIAVGIMLGLGGYPLFSPSAALIFTLALGLALGSDADIEPRGACPHPASALVGGGTRPMLERATRLTAAIMGAVLVVVGILQVEGERRMTAALRESHQALTSARTTAHQAVAIWPSAEILFSTANLDLLGADPSGAASLYRASYPRRPRPETANNLAIALEQTGDSAQAGIWRARSQWLDPRLARRK